MANKDLHIFIMVSDWALCDVEGEAKEIVNSLYTTDFNPRLDSQETCRENNRTNERSVILCVSFLIV